VDEVWIAYLEVIALIDSAPDVGTPGFINVVCSGSDSRDVETKVRDCLAFYNWQILNVESISLVNDDLTYDNNIWELIDDIRQNNDHIRLGTLHSYKVN
jgi:hypothetical protein